MISYPYSKTLFGKHFQKKEDDLQKHPTLGTPIFFFNSQNQAENWKLFYTRALDFLEALEINPDEEDQGKKGWCQIKMMFERDGCQAPQTLIDNNTISPEAPAYSFPSP